MEPVDQDMESLGSQSVSHHLPHLLFLCFLEVWLDETSNKLLEMSLLLEQFIERLDETVKRIDEIKQDYSERGFARLSIQEKIERSPAKRPFTRCEADSLREKHDTVLHMLEVVQRCLLEKYNSQHGPEVQWGKSPARTSLFLINRRQQIQGIKTTFTEERK